MLRICAPRESSSGVPSAISCKRVGDGGITRQGEGWRERKLQGVLYKDQVLGKGVGGSRAGLRGEVLGWRMLGAGLRVMGWGRCDQGCSWSDRYYRLGI